MGGDDLDDNLEYDIQPIVALDNEASDEEEHDTGKQTQADNSKSPKKQTQSQILLEAGRNLQDAESQAAFLNTCLKHYSLLEDSNSQPPRTLAEHQIVLSQHDTLLENIATIVSNRTLKRWKQPSPCVVIVCMSARRAVQLLQCLKPLKLRTAKLFPKNASLSEHQSLLQSTNFGMVVGTPHRLRSLLESNNSLSLSKTQLLILDCQVSHKQYTVCTLPDTAPHCMKLIAAVSAKCKIGLF